MLTPPGRAAVSTVCVSGPVVRELLDLFFEPQSQGLWASQSLNRLFYGNWLGPDGSREDLVVCRKTSEAFEIYCHGGTLPTRRILGNLQSQGCRIGSPWEAMRTETRDLISAEARWPTQCGKKQLDQCDLGVRAIHCGRSTGDNTRRGNGTSDHRRLAGRVDRYGRPAVVDEGSLGGTGDWTRATHPQGSGWHRCGFIISRLSNRNAP